MGQNLALPARPHRQVEPRALAEPAQPFVKEIKVVGGGGLGPVHLEAGLQFPLVRHDKLPARQIRQLDQELLELQLEPQVGRDGLSDAWPVSEPLWGWLP